MEELKKRTSDVCVMWSDGMEMEWLANWSTFSSSRRFRHAAFGLRLRSGIEERKSEQTSAISR